MISDVLCNSRIEFQGQGKRKGKRTGANKKFTLVSGGKHPWRNCHRRGTSGSLL